MVRGHGATPAAAPRRGPGAPIVTPGRHPRLTPSSKLAAWGARGTDDRSRRRYGERLLDAAPRPCELLLPPQPRARSREELDDPAAARTSQASTRRGRSHAEGFRCDWSDWPPLGPLSPRRETARSPSHARAAARAALRWGAAPGRLMARSQQGKRGRRTPPRQAHGEQPTPPTRARATPPLRRSRRAQPHARSALPTRGGRCPRLVGRHP